MLASWPVLRDVAANALPGADGTTALEALSDAFDLCADMTSAADADALIASIQAVFFDLAEANYPFPSTYITSAVGPGSFPLPAWPLRVACADLVDDETFDVTGDAANVTFSVHFGDLRWDVNYDAVTPSGPYSVDDVAPVLDVFRGVKAAWATWCNVTEEKTCLPLEGCATGRRRLRAEVGARGTCTAESWTGGSWGPICCNDNLNLVNYLEQGVGRDFYWPPNVARGATLPDIIGPDGGVDAGCAPAGAGLFGYPGTADPWSHWFHAYFGGKDAVAATSNIVFSNGLLDPWSAAGVYADGVPAPGPYAGPLLEPIGDAARDVTALIIPLGGHHLDLMFMDDADPPCATHARAVELAAIRRWAGLA
jgi:lysosomal Pro-X carboxypeptidase